MSARGVPVPPGTPLAALADVPPDNGLERVVGSGPGAVRVVLFRVADGVRAYRNECPHQRVPFDFGPGVFCVHEVDGDRHLLCPHHAALFRLDDGTCWDGPCVGERLQAVSVAVDAGTVIVA